MTKRRKRWLIAASSALLVGVLVLTVLGWYASRRFEPLIREYAIEYLQDRFKSEVDLAELRIRLPKLSPLKAFFEKGRGTIARVDGRGLRIRPHAAARDLPPVITIDQFHFEVDLGALQDNPRTVQMVSLKGMEINIPPKGERHTIPSPSPEQQEQTEENSTKVLIETIAMNDVVLRILPKNRAKDPLVFSIHDLRFQSAGTGVPMQYEAALTNPKPPGEIRSAGSFGPWNADEPGDTPLKGDYTFSKADLSVFRSIAGILESKGSFEGSLSAIQARGKATIPDFRLAMSGNRVPLQADFEVEVDGTNGNTVLKPVKAVLGSTRLTTSGAVLKQQGDKRRTVDLNVSMPRGNLRDILRLAMKGDPFMEGQLTLNTKVTIPPLDGKVREKLILDGRFAVNNGHFLKSTIQDQIDSLSRRGQGQPKNEEVDEVVSGMQGTFRLENEKLTFRKLSFEVPGAAVNLAGTYDMDADALDFLGNLKLQAKVSQTMTGWKRWALKPVDPFFSKEGAGTFLRIAVTGTSSKPQFGRAGDRGRSKE